MAATSRRVRAGGDRQGDEDGQGREPEAGEHGHARRDHLLDLAVDAEPQHDAPQRHRDDECLEQQSDRRGDEQVRGVLDPGLPRHRGGEQAGVQGKNVQEREHPVLVEQHEADHDHAAGQEMCDIEGVAVHS